MLFEDVSKGAAEDKAKFHSTVAKLLYMAKRARADTLLAVQYSCTKVKEPKDGDVKKLERVLGFLAATKMKSKRIDKSKFERVEFYVDAAFGCHANGKSQSGGVLMLGNTAISEICHKQKIVMKDSTEAELVAMLDHILEAELLDEFMEQQGYDLKVPIVYQDNESMISLVVKGGGKPRTKHMRARQNLVKEMIEKKQVEIVFVRTEQMLADVLTKPLGGMKFHGFAWQLLGMLDQIGIHKQQGCVEQQAKQQARVMWHE
jgi:hypothetical protein